MEVPDVELVVQRTAHSHTDQVGREHWQQKELCSDVYPGWLQFGIAFHEPTKNDFVTMS